jgi:transcriptional regulator with XRE-family HTH domain
MTNTPFEKSHAKALGDRLRKVRNEAGFSLQRVEEKSGGHWKAVVVGSYERGDRAITVIRLIELAAFYGVQAADLLPREPAVAAGPAESAQRLLRRAAALLDPLVAEELGRS